VPLYLLTEVVLVPPHLLIDDLVHDNQDLIERHHFEASSRGSEKSKSLVFLL